jgi:hypothetical protein
MPAIRKFGKWIVLLTPVLMLLCSSPGFATLGEDASSVQADQTHLNASVRVVAAQLYSIHEMQTPAGTTIRQYVSPAGRSSRFPGRVSRPTYVNCWAHILTIHSRGIPDSASRTRGSH